MLPNFLFISVASVKPYDAAPPLLCRREVDCLGFESKEGTDFVAPRRKNFRAEEKRQGDRVVRGCSHHDSMTKHDLSRYDEDGSLEGYCWIAPSNVYWKFYSRVLLQTLQNHRDSIQTILHFTD